MNYANNVSLQAVLLTMMLEKIDNLSNHINEMQIASGDIKQAFDKLNDRISAFEEKYKQVLQHQSSEPKQRAATPVETDEEKETAMPAVAVAPSSVKNKAQTDGSKPAETKRLFEDKPFSLASPQPAAPSPVKTQAQTAVSKPAETKSLFGNQPFSLASPEPAAPSPVKTQAQTAVSKPAETKSLFGDKPFSLASPQPAAPSPVKTQAQTAVSKPAETKSLFGDKPFSLASPQPAAPSPVKTQAQTAVSKPAETKSLFGDKPFSLASPQPAAPSPVKTQAQTVGFKPAGTKSIFGNQPFSFAPSPQPAVATSLFCTLPKESPFGAKPATDVSQPKSLFGDTGSSNKTPLSFASGTSFLDKKTTDAPNDVFGARTSSTFAKQSATEENENPEEYVPDAHYEPVIPLPDKVDVVTGEESEQVLFKNRCKLYIFNSETKEVKERGVGDLKVLYNPEKKNYRAVMRREQVHKICANFRITKGMNIGDKAGTKGCGMFSCIDFSENPQNGTSTLFYARFREENVYEEFKKLFNEIAEGNHVPSGIPSTNAGK